MISTNMADSINGVDYNFLFVGINRTGCSSILRNLNDSRIGQETNKDKYDRDISWSHPQHYSALEWKKVLGEEDFNKRFKFTFVRNPWGKLVSQFTSRCLVGALGFRPGSAHNPDMFNRWAKYVLTYHIIEKCERRPEQCDHERYIHWNCIDWITDRDGNVLVDFIGKQENHEEDFMKVRKLIEQKSGTLITRPQPVRKLHVSNVGFNYRYYYNDETKELVREYFKRDIEEFGYEY